MTSATLTPVRPSYGQLALQFCDVRLPLEVLHTRAGYYIGTTRDCMPCSRESIEYFPTQDRARHALATGQWTQRSEP